MNKQHLTRKTGGFADGYTDCIPGLVFYNFLSHKEVHSLHPTAYGEKEGTGTRLENPANPDAASCMDYGKSHIGSFIEYKNFFIYKNTTMAKKLYKDIPVEYAICEQGDCPRADTCLHQLVYRPLRERGDTYLRLINPGLCTKDDTCPHYRDSAPVTYARGFIGMQQHMFPDQYRRFMSILIGRFSRNPYFERRRGEVALSPKEQKIVFNALRQAGVTEELKFDKYEENINWYD